MTVTDAQLHAAMTEGAIERLLDALGLIPTYALPVSAQIRAHELPMIDDLRLLAAAAEYVSAAANTTIAGIRLQAEKDMQSRTQDLLGGPLRGGPSVDHTVTEGQSARPAVSPLAAVR